ncbi:nitrite reductase (NAD(P)H) small subunit [Streptomyces sp. NPDC059533]|uniref:nitrite reductase (NAD(P)H) small subunit n=1 Tax=unclassified Streptomyces TaxID=2593676 RepID=UPI003697B59A
MAQTLVVIGHGAVGSGEAGSGAADLRTAARGLEPGRGRTAVLADGTMGSRGGVPVVASPMHKQLFDLRTGACLDDPEVSLPVHALD